MTAIDLIDFRSGKTPRSFRSRTIDFRAASSANARCADCPFQNAALSASTYGFSNNPSSNLARNT
jgi:hypothetical protein